jgi:site-specific DNA-cytosine methylase
LDFKIEMLNGFKPDVIWASPPCTTFSVASISTHWKGGKNAYIPKSEASKVGLKILEKTKEIIKKLNPTFYIIENPRGVMRKFMPENNRQTVTYCQYGDTRMKPTDLWTNFKFIGKRCKNRDKCHVSASRGSKTGTQGLKGAKERSVIPPKLCQEILAELESEGDKLSSKEGEE